MITSLVSETSSRPFWAVAHSKPYRPVEAPRGSQSVYSRSLLPLWVQSAAPRRDPPRRSLPCPGCVGPGRGTLRPPPNERLCPSFPSKQFPLDRPTDELYAFAVVGAFHKFRQFPFRWSSRECLLSSPPGPVEGPVSRFGYPAYLEEPLGWPPAPRLGPSAL